MVECFSAAMFVQFLRAMTPASYVQLAIPSSTIKPASHWVPFGFGRFRGVKAQPVQHHANIAKQRLSNPQSPRAAENPATALALALALCERQCERLVWGASEGLATQDGSNRRFLARTDSNSHSCAPHKLMIQDHLEHALNAFGMRFALQSSSQT
jgi:hypothetical protein